MVREETKPHILIVEDARDIREPLARTFHSYAFGCSAGPPRSAASHRPGSSPDPSRTW